MSSRQRAGQSGKSVPGRQASLTEPDMPSSHKPLNEESMRLIQQREQREKPDGQGGGGSGRGEGGGGEGGGSVGGAKGLGGGVGGGTGGGGDGGDRACRSRMTSTATRSNRAPRSSLIQVWSRAAVSQGVSWSSEQASITASLVCTSRYSISFESISSASRRKRSTYPRPSADPSAMRASASRWIPPAKKIRMGRRCANNGGAGRGGGLGRESVPSTSISRSW